MKRRLLLVFILLGCTPITPDKLADREYRRNEDALMWDACQRAHTRAMKSMHSHDRGRRHRPEDIRSDLTLNHCKRILGDDWKR